MYLTGFIGFDLTTLLDYFVNTEHFIHFSHWASTLFNLITQGKKIQFPLCRNPLLQRPHHHNYQILFVSIFSHFAERIYITMFWWYSNVEHLWCWHIWSKSVVSRFRYWYTVRHNTSAGFAFSIFIQNCQWLQSQMQF